MKIYVSHARNFDYVNELYEALRAFARGTFPASFTVKAAQLNVKHPLKDKASAFADKPLKKAGLPVEFIFPHEKGNGPYNAKLLFERHGCDYILAEVSTPSTGQGIELGWADIFGIPIICFYKTGTTPANSLKIVTDKVIEYGDDLDLVNKLMVELKLNYA